MVRRNLQSDFVGGAYVFPGGSVDPLDGGAEAEAACVGRSDAEASILLGVDSGGLAYWVAALRETFEEAGLLLAERPGGPALLAGEPEEEARFVAERATVNAGTRRFLDLCRDEGLRLQVGDVHYFAHWITPQGAPRRFDTRFFVAAAPPGQQAAHDAGETIADTWISPHRALEGHRNGRLRDHLPDHPQPAGHQPFRHCRRAVGGGRARLALGADHRAAGGGRRERGADPAPGRRRVRRRAGRPSRPTGRETFNDAIRRISKAANQEGGPTDGGVSVPSAGAAPA